MRTLLTSALAGLVLSACSGTGTAPLTPGGTHEVFGVEDDDMLKLRAGPGTGFVSLLGLPNGTVVDVIRCEPNGNTRWCQIRLGGAGGVTGHVSGAYLRDR